MNTYVKENIKKYVELDANPEYAILLNGAWGCGKTYFINELLKESWLNKPKDKEVIKISLYGLNSTKEIENQLFYEANLLLKTNKKIKNAGGIVNRVLKAKYNIDASLIVEMFIKEWSKKIGVLIIDDIERASMPMHDIMGYFYNHIIESNIRIIFIGNEDEIKQIDGNNDDYYNKTKEKVIGEIYTIEPEIEKFIKQFFHSDMKEFPIDIQEVQKIALKVVNDLEIKNIRNIKRGFFKAKNILELVKESKAFKGVNYQKSEYGKYEHTKDDYLNEIFESCLVLYFQFINDGIEKQENEKQEDKKQENKEQNNFIRAISVYKNYQESLKIFNEREPKEYYNSMDFQTDFIPFKLIENLWENYLIYYKIDKKLLEKAVEKDKEWFTIEKVLNSNLEKLNKKSLEMEQEEFEICYKTFIKELKNGKYVDIDELIDAYSLLLTYEKYGVCKYKKGEIKELFDKVLKTIDIKVDIKRDYNDIYLKYAGSHLYKVIFEKKELEIFFEKLKCVAKEKQKKIMKKKFIKQFDDIKSKELFQIWTNSIYSSNNKEQYNLYLNKPILSWIGSDKLYSKIKKYSLSVQCSFMFSIRHRLEGGCTLEAYEAYEIDFKILKKLELKYENEINILEEYTINKYKLGIELEELKSANKNWEKLLMQYKNTLIKPNEGKSTNELKTSNFIDK